MKTKGYRLLAIALVLMFGVQLLPVQAMASDAAAGSGTTAAEAEPTKVPPAASK